MLTQLLATDDAAEMSVIQTSLMSLFRRDAKGTLVGLFSQVRLVLHAGLGFIGVVIGFTIVIDYESVVDQ